MLEYWIQSGETRLMEVKEENKNQENIIIDKLIDPLFQNDGNTTVFTQKYFGQISYKTKDKKVTIRTRDDLKAFIKEKLLSMSVSNNEKCFICGKKGAARLKGWIFPFVISHDKFPNISNEISICKDCALKSFAAYTTVLFNVKKSYLSFIVFFADTSENLIKFRRLIRVSLQKQFITTKTYNWKQHDIIYYPYEFAAYVINDLAMYIKKCDEIYGIRVGAFVVGANISGRKKVYSQSSVITNLNELARLYITFRGKIEKMRDERAERLMIAGMVSPDSDKDPFLVLFQFMKKEISVTKITPDIFLARNAFFKRLYRYRDIDWKATEEILFYRARENNTVPFLKDFLKTAMEVFNMSDKELFDKVSGLGYNLGKSLLQEGKQRERAKQYLFELRRKRTIEEFLDALNLIQIYVESPLDDRPFRENEKLFYKLKVFFLIGMANAIFQKQPQGLKKEE